MSAVATLALSCAAHAGSIALFNTGVDGGTPPTPLADGTIGDPHYTLISVPGGTTDIRVRLSTGGYPVGPWLGDNGTSAWIGPNNDAQVDGPVGDYVFRTTFDLTGFDPATAFLTGRWATDNTGPAILINGVPTGNSSPCFDCFTFTDFSIGSGFIAGVNTLDFVVNNGGGPIGLRVEISGTANTVPEPASLVLIGAGLVALSVLRRRARS